MKKLIDKWKSKKLIDKIGDILFLGLLIAMIIPSSRMALTVAVKRVFAFSPREISREERVSLIPDEYNWLMEDESGNVVNLADFIGRTLFINEWATWCPPCVAEMPSIQKLYDRLKDDKSVAFIIITNEKRSTVEDFMDKEGYTFPYMIARSNPPEPFAVRSIPTTFLVAPSGEIVLKEVGSKKWHGEDTVELISNLSRRP
ncbi:TlpA family protein disulfide reductase [Spirochaeta isovalerica]|uniref:Thiol-disulfide isomerase/thioredoxin n=1 Tax=Spirochaeta isovalerica TaxID=150 RepID=A0A841RIH0_9SPIO|nr:TlpA disulfide reductase family protein [Spirochaeta isovalerica]MBB6482102.1 thiol-disulfide isomerase/thioredoxin [Spirochaeta isovalerica]